MADDKNIPATEEHPAPEATSPETPGGVPAQPTVETVTAEQTHTPADNVIPFGGAGTDLPSPGEEDTREPWEKTQDELNAENKKPRRGRPPKEATEQTGPVGDKKMGFMPAVELSYIKPKNQRLIAVSIEGEQASPSLSQAQKLRELDKEGKLNGDVIDGILSQEKKADLEK